MSVMTQATIYINCIRNLSLRIEKRLELQWLTSKLRQATEFVEYAKSKSKSKPKLKPNFLKCNMNMVKIRSGEIAFRISFQSIRTSCKTHEKIADKCQAINFTIK